MMMKIDPLKIVHDKEGNGCYLVFYDLLKKKLSKTYYPDGIKCPECKKLIEGNNFYKKGSSFDIYHPRCYKKRDRQIFIICDDIIDFEKSQKKS